MALGKTFPMPGGRDRINDRGNSMSTVETKLITAQEFFALPDSEPCELVCGKVVTMNPPGWRHGNIAGWIMGRLAQYLDRINLGRLSSCGVITEREPDTVRGADVCFYSYTRLPREVEPDDYPELPPEIIWEVLSPGNRWKDVLAKVSEYLEAGVLQVCIVDPKRRCFVTYYPDRPDETINEDDIWRAEEILPGFELPVKRVFGKSTSG